MRHKQMIGLLLLAVIASAVVFLGFQRAKSDSRLLSLKFQRYSSLDPRDGVLGFFWLTNASEKAFLLCETGGSNTIVFDTMFSPNEVEAKFSYMVNCAFSDQTPHGSTNWVQKPLPTRGYNSFLQLPPHSGIVIRVPLPPNGQRRKVAAICETPSPAWKQSPLWRTGFVSGLLGVLPRSVLLRLAQYQPPTIEVWCDKELSDTDARMAQ